jgi:hypothetical protein
MRRKTKHLCNYCFMPGQEKEIKNRKNFGAVCCRVGACWDRASGLQECAVF